MKFEQQHSGCINGHIFSLMTYAYIKAFSRLGPKLSNKWMMIFDQMNKKKYTSIKLKANMYKDNLDW